MLFINLTIFISFFLFIYFFKFILFCFAWENDYIFGNGESRIDLRKEKVNGLCIFWNEKSWWEEECLLKASMDLGELEKICKEGPHATTIGKWCGALKNGQHVFTMRVKGDSVAREKGISSVLVNEWSRFYGKIQGRVGRKSHAWMKEIVSVTWKEDLPFQGGWE